MQVQCVIQDMSIVHENLEHFGVELNGLFVVDRLTLRVAGKLDDCNTVTLKK